MDTRIILFLIAILGYLFIGRKSKKSYVILMCVVLCFEAGLRHLFVGSDTYRYYLNFMDARTMTWGEIWKEFIYTYVNGTSKDPGYLIVEKLFHYVSDEWQLFLFAIAAFYFYALGRFIYQNTSKPIHVLFAFILYISLFHIILLCLFRQAIGMAITFLFFPLLVKKKWVVYVIIALLASTIHRSVLLTLILIPLAMLSPINKKRALLLSFLSVPIMTMYARTVVAYMAETTQNEYYTIYAESEGYGGAIIYFIMCAAVAVYILMNLSHFNTWQKNIYVAGITLLSFFSPLVIVHGALIRISQYFAFYMMFAIPVGLDNIRVSKSSNLFYTIAICVLILLTFRTPFIYYFYWENVPASLYM